MQRARIKRARSQITLTEFFFGALIVLLKMEETDQTPTMSTDGVSIYWNPEYTKTISDAILRTMFLHEVLHVALCHHLRRGTRDPELWNIAADYVVNAWLVRANYTLWPGALYDPKYAGWAVETVYNDLLKDSNSRPKPTPQPGGVQDFPKPSTTEKQHEEERVKIAVSVAASTVKTQAEKRKGSMPAWISDLVKEILRPKVDWRQALLRFTEPKFPGRTTWNRPNRRFSAMGVYLPSRIRTGMGTIVLYRDTSGSVGPHEQDQFYAEISTIHKLIKPELLVVVDCDCRVKDTIQYREHETVALTYKGGGGSDFRPAFKHIEKLFLDIKCAIVLSDMQIDFPTTPPTYPVLGVSTTDTKGPSWMETVFIKDINYG